jgi:hypothetical protein
MLKDPNLSALANITAQVGVNCDDKDGIGWSDTVCLFGMCVREFVVIVGRLIIIRIKMTVINRPARTLLRIHKKMRGKMSKGRAVVSSCI